jgi:TRAP-type uncharacterized transport system substrate-binding protein
MLGDPYGANLTKICNWLAYELEQRAGPGSRCAIEPGDAGAENVLAVARGEADLTAVTPGGVVAAALRGVGPFAERAHPNLRALGELPHRDGLLFAVREDLEISSIAELRERQTPLRLTTALGGKGRPYTGYAAERVLLASGLAPDTLRAWGGEVTARQSPYECLADVDSGAADGILHEAIMEPLWHATAANTALSYLSLEPEVLTAMEVELACSAMEIPAGWLTGMDEPVSTVDFSGFVVVVRDDMEADVARVLASIMDETVDRFIGLNYRHLPVDRSAVRFPVTRADLTSTPIPLHDAVAEYYAEERVA